MSQLAGPPHILILSDTAAAISLLTLALEPEGYKVTSFLVGSAARASSPGGTTWITLDLETITAMRPPPTAIVHDLRLPQHQAAAQRFLLHSRQDPVVRRIPLLLCTGAAIRDLPITGAMWEDGSVRLLPTPLDIDALLAVLEQVLAVVRVGDS